MGQTVFSETIRELRQNAGYTQAEVSRILNIQRQTYCNYENALRNPPLEIIVALAELYHVSIDHLVRGTDCAPAAGDSASLSPSEKKLLEGFSVLPEQLQREVLEFVQFKKQLGG